MSLKKSREVLSCTHRDLYQPFLHVTNGELFYDLGRLRRRFKATRTGQSGHERDQFA